MGVRWGQAEGRESWDPSKDKGSEGGSGQSMTGAGTPKGKGLGGTLHLVLEELSLGCLGQG